MPLAASAAQRRLERGRDLQLGLPGANRREHLGERLLRQIGGGANGRHLLGRLHRPEPLHHVRDRHHAAARHPTDPLGVLHRHRVRLDADHRRWHRGEHAAQTVPHALLVHLDVGRVPRLRRCLDRVPEVGHQRRAPRVHQQERGRAGEAGQVSDVGEMGDQQGVEPLRRHRRPQRRLPLGAPISRHECDPPAPAAPAGSSARRSPSPVPPRGPRSPSAAARARGRRCWRGGARRRGP